MPKGQYIRKKTNVPYKTLKIQSENFKVNVRFLHKNSNSQVWLFLGNMISKEFQGFQEVSEALLKMSQEELNMLDY